MKTAKKTRIIEKTKAKNLIRRFIKGQKGLEIRNMKKSGGRTSIVSNKTMRMAKKKKQ